MTLRRTESVEAGDWIAPRLGSWGTAAGVTPRGFEAYARVFHPVEAQFLRWEGDRLLNSVEDSTIGLLSWAEVARRRGTSVHPLMQWEKILAGHTNPRYGEDGWQYGSPQQGDVGARELAVICRVLETATGTPADCTAAVWEGWGDLVEKMPWEILPAPELVLPSRTYLMFDCGTADFTDHPTANPRAAVTTQPTDGLFRTLNLLWPADLSWFIGSEIDFDSTVIGGPRAAIDRLLASAELEAMEIGPDDSLAHDTDAVNGKPHPHV
ncbi:MAG: hypothetical protein JWQ43_2984 [Glaciihabitans sp.]|nr:hypothetical protein [Glaciihabitans sp.]